MVFGIQNQDQNQVPTQEQDQTQESNLDQAPNQEPGVGVEREDQNQNQDQNRDLNQDQNQDQNQNLNHDQNQNLNQNLNQNWNQGSDSHHQVPQLADENQSLATNPVYGGADNTHNQHNQHHISNIIQEDLNLLIDNPSSGAVGTNTGNGETVHTTVDNNTNAASNVSDSVEL